jgi:hypothetical protein
MNGTLHLINAVGMKVEFEIADEGDAFEKMRAFGARGWTSGDVPAGGFVLPRLLAERFDWRLIGATSVTFDGAQGVMHRGLFYKRRDLPEKKFKGHTMPACVKYSRGAKPTDENAEGGDDEINYVTLVIFKGKAPIDERLAVPSREAPAVQKSPVRGEELANRIADGTEDELPPTEDVKRAIYTAAQKVGIPHRELQAIAFSVTQRHDYREAPSLGQQRRIFDAVAHWTWPKAGATA